MTIQQKTCTVFAAGLLATAFAGGCAKTEVVDRSQPPAERREVVRERVEVEKPAEKETVIIDRR